MLLHLLEAALRSFALGGAVWLGLRFLRLRNPQTRMTAWTVVLMVSLLMPALMHWATVSVPIYSPTTSDAAIAPASPVTLNPVPPTEPPPEKMSLPPAPDSAGIAGRFPRPDGSPRAAIGAIDWQVFAIGLHLAVVGGLLLRLAIGLALTWRLMRRGRRLDAEWAAGCDVRVCAAVATPVTFGTTILLPAECLDWSPIKRRAVLAHERSHEPCRF